MKKAAHAKKKDYSHATKYRKASKIVKIKFLFSENIILANSSSFISLAYMSIYTKLLVLLAIWAVLRTFSWNSSILAFYASKWSFLLEKLPDWP